MQKNTIGIDARLLNETGVGRYIRNLVKYLAEIDKKNQYILFLRRKDYDILEVPGENFKKRLADIRWHTLEEQIKFVKILNKEKMDLMHFPYFSFPYLYRKKFVMTIHDLIIHHFSTGQASTLPKFIYGTKVLGYKFLLQSGAKRAEKIITVSNATKKEIVDHLNIHENKIVVTYEGIDENVSSIKYLVSSKRTTKVLTSSRGRFAEVASSIKVPYFLYVGNAYPHKNLEKLIEAFCLLQQGQSSVLSQSDIKLVLVGKEDFFYKRLKRKIAELGFNQSIIFYHEVSDYTLSNLYQHAIALISPSLMEGFGLPAVEAMANKCLVLVSDTPVFKEVCEDAAIYFDQKDAKDISKKMLEVYKNKDEYKYKIKKGLERVKQFSWEKMAKETLQIYEDCISL